MTKIIETFKQKDNKISVSISVSMSLSLALLSGILIGTSYIPFPAWAVAFCYLPLWWAAIKQIQAGNSYKFTFFLGWITQFVLTLIGFNWIYFTAREFGNLPHIVSLITLLLFATFIHLYIPLALVAAHFLKNKFKLSQTNLILTIALSHILFERFWPSIFEWNLGYTFLWMKWPLAQWADVVGFWGLSAWIFVFQVILFLGLLSFQHHRKKSIAYFVFLILAAVTLWVGGEQKQKPYLTADSEFKVSIIQANIANDEKLQSEKGYEFQPYVLNLYFEQTEKNLLNNSPDMIIWPETALPIALDTVYHRRTNQHAVLSKVSLWQTNLVTGAYSQDPYKKDHLGYPLIRNSVFFLNPTGETNPPYFKTDLLVFGEYMPFGEELPFLYKLLPFVGVYEKGPGPVNKKIQLKNADTLNLGPQICYESLNPSFSRKLAEIGNQVFFNLTNDSWFGSWAEPYQHMIMTLARGLENRRPLLRSTNTGISTVILASGEILEQSPIYQKWEHTYTVPYSKNPELTFYTRWGYLDWIVWAILLAIVLGRESHARRKKP